MSEAKPVRWRPCEAGARPNFYELSPPKITIFYSIYLGSTENFQSVFYNTDFSHLVGLVIAKKTVEMLTLDLISSTFLPKAAKK